MGCSLLLDPGSFTDNAGGEVPGGDAGGDANGGQPDAGHDAQPDVPPNNGCPTGRGPAMLRVGNDAGISFCIDTTEVTGGQYREFLTHNPTGTGICSYKTSFVPHDYDTDADVPPGDTTPAVEVDWCDAYTFCAWAGKRLCGRIGGGPGSASAPGDPGSDQWMFACSAGGTRAYPYGQQYTSGKCNDTSKLIEPVPTSSTCQGGFSGLFDMSGNVEEWEDACESNAREVYCLTRGGSAQDYRTDDAAADDPYSCAYPYGGRGDVRTHGEPDVGFRCCAD